MFWMITRIRIASAPKLQVVRMLARSKLRATAGTPQNPR